MDAPSASPQTRRWTLLEWAGLPEDEPGELVDGAIEEDEVAGWAHEVVVAWLLSTLHAWAQRAGARVVGSDVKLGVSTSRGRKADLVVYAKGSRRPPAHGLIRVPPTVVIEVVSPNPSDARRDRLQKLDDYAAFGARWYWIVDPQLRTVEIHELGSDGRYVRALGICEGVREDVPGCSGLVLDVSAMWADLDAAIAESDG